MLEILVTLSAMFLEVVHVNVKGQGHDVTLNLVTGGSWISINQFIEQKDQSATYIDMHEMHVETV